VRIFRTIVEMRADLVPIGGADLVHRGRISPKPVGDDGLRHLLVVGVPSFVLHGGDFGST
jgi:hypothetical protein